MRIQFLTLLCFQWELYEKYDIYRYISNIRRTKIPQLKRFTSRVAVVFVQSIEGRCYMENEIKDVIGAAPAMSVWSAI